MRMLRVAAWILLAAAPVAAKGKADPANVAARAACAEVLAKGNLDGLRVGWTQWLDRSVSLTVEVKGGKLLRYGGRMKNQKSERALTEAERKELLEALRGARADRLVWIDRDVKSENDRVLNLDVVAAGGAPQPVGAFVRSLSTWRSGATSPLADLLEKWLAP